MNFSRFLRCSAGIPRPRPRILSNIQTRLFASSFRSRQDSRSNSDDSFQPKLPRSNLRKYLLLLSGLGAIITIPYFYFRPSAITIGNVGDCDNALNELKKLGHTPASPDMMFIIAKKAKYLREDRRVKEAIDLLFESWWLVLKKVDSVTDIGGQFNPETAKMIIIFHAYTKQ
jgi:hypothetical protein